MSQTIFCQQCKCYHQELLSEAERPDLYCSKECEKQAQKEVT